MDLLTRVATFAEDVREIPLFRRIQESMKRVGAAGFKTAGYVIRDRADEVPDREFLRFENESVTFGDYNAGVNRYANLVRRAGVGRGEAVAIMMENSPSFLMAEGAMAKVGSIGALLNTSLRGESLRHVLNASGARVVLADSACAEALAEISAPQQQTVFASQGEKSLRGVRSLEDALVEAGASEPEIPDVNLSDVFLYIYTSGTTGYPKAAVIRHARFSLGGESLRVVLGLEDDDCSYAPTPLYHGYSNFVGFAPALHNGSAFASRRRFSAGAFLDDAIRHRVTHFMYVGELCRYLLRQPPSGRDRAHRIRVATGPGLRPDIWRAFVERFGIDRVIETYGQTEANVSLMNRRGRFGSVGRAAPFTHQQLRLVRVDLDAARPLRGPDGFLTECGRGEVGELVSAVAAGAAMPFDGYVNKEDNEEKLMRDCFAKGDTFLRTGDLLRRDAASYYYFVDRIGDTFRWKGENVATMEVAERLNGAPGIDETAIYGVRVPQADGRAGMALLVLQEGRSFDADAYYRFAREVLPPYARPLFLRIAGAMDVTGTLKHTKRRLSEEGFDPSSIRDELYLRDDEHATYVPLDRNLFEEISQGRVRL